MNDRIRWSMSLRQRDDKLIEHFSGIVDGDRSAECRRLMYLGLEVEDLLNEHGISREQLLGYLNEMGQVPEQETPSVGNVRQLRQREPVEQGGDILNKRLDKLI